MQPQHAHLKVRRLCQLLAVSRRGSDEWRSRPPRAQAQGDQEGQDNIQRYGAQGRGPYGTRRLQHLWTQDGLQGQPSPPRAHLGPGGPALQATAPMQHSSALRAGTDGGPAPTQPGVHGASPREG